ncbi:MAG: hypothetical protein HY287_17805 [Planctomycetes bacterium]|nr:hypothetical protein [Planctomycetota bacterium]MBI3836179.1 hypothetical protein [Planctomycetota bacterium]
MIDRTMIVYPAESVVKRGRTNGTIVELKKPSQVSTGADGVRDPGLKGAADGE